MTESQKAFEAWFDVNYAAYYGQQAPIAVKTAWQAAEAYGRAEQATEIAALKAQLQIAHDLLRNYQKQENATTELLKD